MKYLLIILLFASCDCGIKKGYVLEKRYQPPHEYNFTTIQLCGKTQIPISHQGITTEKYIITIYDISQDTTDTNEFELTKIQFDKYKIGDYFNKDSIK